MPELVTDVFDFFCGAGGFSTGAAKVPGARIVLAVDNLDKYGERCLRRHAKHHPNAVHLAMRLGGRTGPF